MCAEQSSPLLDEVRECSFQTDGVDCAAEVLGRCAKCGQFFCLDHASEIDPNNYCIICLTSEDAGFEERPLVDTEGHAHKGREITHLNEVYKTTNKLITELSDAELEAFITQYTLLVREAERMTDYRRITLGSAQHEKYERERGILKKVGGVIRFGITPALRPAPTTAKRKREARPKTVEGMLDAILGKMKASGLTDEQIGQTLAKLAGKK